MTDEVKEGWGFPGNARKAHYFVGGKSLCGKWMFLGSNLEPAGEGSCDDCVSCTRKLVKRLAAVPPTQ